MALYNCQHAGDEYRITKFDSFGNVESSYLCTFSECQCPAGVRPLCRHREMLPKFIARGAVNTGWQLDYDRGGWVDNRTEDELMPPLPEGVQAFSLEDPATLHNAIAEAVGEPEAELAPAPKIGLKLNPNPEPGKGFVEFTTTLPPTTWRRF